MASTINSGNLGLILLHDGSGNLTFQTNSTNALSISNSQNITLNSTTVLQLNAGNTSQRPISSSQGQIRYNTDTAIFEGYSSNTWSPLVSGATSLSNGTSNLIISNSSNISIGINGINNVIVVSNTIINSSLAVGGFEFATGNTAQRPGTPANGTARWNSTNSELEVYTGLAGWVTIAKGAQYAIDYLIVAGGGGGGGWGGGGGAGGYVSGNSTVTPNTSYSIVVGAGGAAGTNAYSGGGQGGISSFPELPIAQGGGGGGYYGGSVFNFSSDGGSGGGGPVDTGNNSTVGGWGVYGQGNNGGQGGPTISSPTAYYGAGGGGGASAVGSNYSGYAGGPGGAGSTWLNSITYAGGGGGHTPGNGGTSSVSSGGSGGGGNGGNYYSPQNAQSGSSNTGGGGGGAWGGPGSAIGSGGSGIVIIRYAGGQRATGGTVTSAGGYTYHTFTSSGTFVA